MTGFDFGGEIADRRPGLLMPQIAYRSAMESHPKKQQPAGGAGGLHADQ
jgi:hypothetical protein